MAFDQTMTEVAGIMRATTAEMETLTAAARLMGETTEFTASQAGSALRFLGMAGFEAAEATQALPGVLDLATAGTLDLGRAADIASNALTAMKLPVRELSRVNDVFIGTITRSNVNMEMMAESFKYSAPVAKAFGYSIEERSGMIGMLGSAGIQGSMAGTQLAMAFQKANDIAAEFGYESADLLDVLEAMGREGRTAADIMDLFGLRAGRAALILKEVVTETKAFQETLGRAGGEASRLADKMRKTVTGSFKELKSVIESVAIDAFGLYQDRLLDTIKSLTSWIREHKDTLLGMLDVLIASFGYLIGVIRILWTILSALPVGVIDFFKDLAASSEEAATKIEESGEKIRAALIPPDPTPWQQLVMFLEQTGKNILAIFEFLARAIGNTLAALLKFIVSDILWNLGQAVFNFFHLISSGLTLNFKQMETDLKNFRDNFVSIWTGGDVTGTSMIGSWVDAWKDFANKLDFRTTSEIWADSFKQTADDIGESAERLSEAITDAGNKAVHTAKAVTQVTQGEGAKVKETLNDRIRLLSMEIDLLEELLSQTKLTTSNMNGYWVRYYDKRRQLIEAEANAMIELGISADIVASIVTKRTKDIDNEIRRMLGESSFSLKDWALSLSDDLTRTFEEFFFETMKGEFRSLYDYLEAITDIFLRNLAQKAAYEFSNIIGLAPTYNQGYGGPSLFSFGGGGSGNNQPQQVEYKAEGGVVYRPTLTVIGEVPEAVIPLHKLRDTKFLNSLGSAGGGRRNDV